MVAEERQCLVLLASEEGVVVAAGGELDDRGTRKLLCERDNTRVKRVIVAGCDS